jgi:predicted NAD/FAD-binding protein
MNLLQGLRSQEPLLVSLNPAQAPDPAKVIGVEHYEHPLYDHAALTAQERLWSLQGVNRTWFCGAHFGAGFHEDGLQTGLAVAEAIGGVRRPWRVADESGRIHLGPPETAAAA